MFHKKLFEISHKQVGQMPKYGPKILKNVAKFFWGVSDTSKNYIGQCYFLTFV